ncbi:hypothetical protein LTR85_003849 [Meristemomyces frigidus]|nr:hypothetical protein LTR85_003849 [Meristemomyces frigidus]
MATSASSQTTFLVMSDTHNFEMDTADEGCPLRQPMPKVDILLHCGDLTQIGGISAYKKAVRLLGAFDAELKLVIAGNHDLSLDGKFWRGNLDEEAGDELEEHQQAVDVLTGPLTKANGITYLTEGLHKFTLKSGATFTIYASPYQPEFGDWAFGYKRTDDRFNVQVPQGVQRIAENPLPNHVDIVMTHGPPRGILDSVPSREHAGTVEHLGCDALLRAIERSRPLMHCFGHLHEGYGAEMEQWRACGQEDGTRSSTVSISKVGTTDDEPKAYSMEHSTLMVNAAVMDGHNKPVNAPWLVSLELPRGI